MVISGDTPGGQKLLDEQAISPGAKEKERGDSYCLNLDQEKKAMVYLSLPI